MSIHDLCTIIIVITGMMFAVFIAMSIFEEVVKKLFAYLSNKTVNKE
jgi:hypothetical protein